MNLKKKYLSVILIYTLLGSNHIIGQWSIDSRINTSISATDKDKIKVSMISDGEDGAIITWEELGNNNDNIYVQKINSFGEVQWTTDGVVISTANSDQSDPSIISDGKGGAIITWEDDRNGLYDIYAQRINSFGEVQWTVDGEVVSTSANEQLGPSIISDGKGGAIITWRDSRNSNWDIYAQRINSFGEVQWLTDGVPISTTVGNKSFPRITSDGDGGAIIIWITEEIYAQRINSIGEVQWSTDGVAISIAGDSQGGVNIISDTEGGAIITWQEFTNESSFWDVYAQKINSFGEVQWTTNGVPISIASNYQVAPSIIGNAEGGAIITWRDSRNSNWDIYAQRINSFGEAQWTINGIPISTADDNQLEPQIKKNGKGDYIISWQDFRSGNFDVYAQKINSLGEPQWNTDGIAVSTAANNQSNPSIISNGKGGAILTWLDLRSGNSDIYAQRIGSQGYLGMANPNLVSIEDVPGDQGSKVNVIWNASDYDVNSEKLIEYYSIWRSVELNGTALMNNVIERKNMKIDFKGKAYLEEETTSGNLYWEWLGNTPAHYLANYSYQAETQSDSSSMNSMYTKYFVSAHTDDQFLFWDSKIDSGYSVDNLSPLAPQLLYAAMLPGSVVELTWAQNRIDKDVRDYVIHRSVENDFSPDASTQIAIVTDTVYTDENLPKNIDELYYRVVTRDTHDNESDPSNSISVVLTSIENNSEEIPIEYQLSQNYPNPFNPNTIIQYSIPKQSHVTLKVFDVLGSEVISLVAKDHSAGNYTLEFNAGNYPSGVYFYRIQAGSYSKTRKMILTK